MAPNPAAIAAHAAFIAPVLRRGVSVGPFTYLIDGATIRLIPSTSTMVELVHIEVPPDRQRLGIGSRVLKLLCEIGDETDTAIILCAMAPPYCVPPLTTAQLIAWYHRNGFRPANSRDPDILRRDPQNDRAIGPQARPGSARPERKYPRRRGGPPVSR